MANLVAKKIALLKVGQKQLGLDNESYRAILRQFGGVESTSDLSEAGFLRVVLRMTELGFRSTWTKRTYGERVGMASPAQVELIRKLWTEYHGGDDEAALAHWLRHFHHVDALRFVTAETAARIIPGLKAMARRRRE